MTSFKKWFLQGSGAKSGFRKLVNWRLPVHIAIGCVLYLLVPVDLTRAGNTALLPLAGIFIGLAFAWGGNANALLQTQEIEDLSGRHEGGFEEYVYTYQLAILVILVSLFGWGLAGLGVFDQPSLFSWGHRFYFVAGVGLYSLASLAFQECWSVVRGAQFFLLARNEIRKAKNRNAGG